MVIQQEFNQYLLDPRVLAEDFLPVEMIFAVETM